MDFNTVDILLDAFRNMTGNNNILKNKIDKFLNTGILKHSFTCDDGIYYEGHGFELVYSELENNNHMTSDVDVYFNDGSIVNFKNRA